MKAAISVIIVNFKGEKYITDSLDSIFKEQGNYEVIVVDSASPDGSVKLLKKRYKNNKKFKLMELKKNWGPAKGRNLGAQTAKGKYLFFLCYDTIVKPGWYDGTLDFFKRHPDVSCFQPKLLRRGTRNYDYAGDNLTSFGFLRERARGAVDTGQFDYETPIFSLKIAGMGMKANDFRKVGGFDEDMAYMWEETDFTWRLWLAGKKVYFNPYITIYHAYVTKDKNRDYYAEANVTYQGARNNIFSILKNIDTPGLMTTLIPNILSYCILSLMFLIRLDVNRSWAILKGIGWNLYHIRLSLGKRRFIQRRRTMKEHELFNVVGVRSDMMYYIGKAVSYVRGQSF